MKQLHIHIVEMKTVKKKTKKNKNQTHLLHYAQPKVKLHTTSFLHAFS